MTFAPSQPPTPSSIFINRCTWKSSQYYITIIMMASFKRMSQKLVFHQSKCICAIKRILSTTAMYVSSSSFMYLRIPCYCDAWLNSSDLRVGLKTLLNTIARLGYLQIFKTENFLSSKHCHNYKKVALAWSSTKPEIALFYLARGFAPS